MKPGLVRLRTMHMAPLHVITKQLGSPLSKELRQKYHQRSVRVIEGDTIKVLRGEFKGIEGKVTNVSTLKRGIAVEGIKREKLKGGNVDIYIHPSNVLVTVLNLEDKWRQNKLEGQKPKAAKPAQSTETAKPEEKPKTQKVTKEKQKDTKSVQPQKTQTKETKPNDKSDKEKSKPKTKEAKK